MSESFPLVNLRQTIDKQWEQVETIESVTVPASKVLKLKEVPDDGSVSPKIVITGLTETTVYPPNSGEFFVNYCTGYIEFHDDQIVSSVDITYWAKGSLVESEDINYINNKHIVSTVAPTGYYGQQWFNSNNGITYNYDIRDKWLSFDRQMFTFGRQGKSQNMYLPFYGGTLPSNKSGLRLIRDACITGFAAQIKDAGTCAFEIRKNSGTTAEVVLNINNAYGAQDDSLDVDLDQGDTLHCYINSVLSNIYDPMIMIELSWR